MLASTFVAWGAVLAAQALGLPATPGSLMVVWLTAPAAWYASRQAARVLRRRALPERSSQRSWQGYEQPSGW
jgi:hypothetical protein